MPRRLRWLSLACLVIFPVALIAAPPQPVSINDASADTNTGFLTITGANFGTSAPTVVVDGFVLTIQSYSPSQIIAVLPGSVVASPGSYALTVTRNSGNPSSTAEFIVTVGAQGPGGPAGATGATGATGANGANGADGAPGAIGPTGPAGANGTNGAVGPTGPAGVSGAPGPTGPTGPAGAGITVETWSGFIGDLAPDNAAYHFAGPQATVTTTAGQRLTGAATAALGKGPDTGTLLARVGLCYQASAGGPLVNFVGINYIVANVEEGVRHTYSATASAVPGAGTWKVGFCTFHTASPLDNNDFVNGWVMVQ